MFFNEQKRNTKNTTRGFSLVELMVALTIFSIVMTVSVGTLLVLIDANAKAQALSSAMTNLSFAIDSMTRNIRTGNTFYCTNGNTLSGSTLPDGVNNCGPTKTGIVFTPGFENSTRMAYRIKNSAIEQWIDKDGQVDGWVPITSAEGPAAITIRTLEFNVVGEEDTTDMGGSDDFDYIQPRISILIQGEVSNGLATPTTFKIQSNVTQRVLDY